MTPEQERGEACSVCGRTLDSIIPVVEVELRGNVLRACAGQCVKSDGTPIWLDPQFTADKRVEFRLRLRELEVMLDEAREAGNADFLDAISMSLKVMQETRRVLGLDAPVKVELVTEPDPRIPPADVARIARDAARDYYSSEDDD